MKLCLLSALLFTSATSAARAQTTPSHKDDLLAYDKDAKALLAQMTLDEKLGQMMQVGQAALRNQSDIENMYLGSLLSGGGERPRSGNTLQDWSAMLETYQRHAMSTRLHIPLLYGIDAVHGHNNIAGATIFPHNIGLGCTRDPDLIEKIEHVTAQEVRATAINWAFGPCVTVPQDIRWGRTYEGYSSDPDIVAPLGAAAVRGFQGTLGTPDSIISSAKHFLGDGGTTLGTGQAMRAARGNPAGGGGGTGNRGLDQGDTRLDEATLRAIHLPGYISAINAGVATIMPSYSSWNGTKVSASKHLLTDILKTELGFQGFLISDYNALDQINPQDYKSSVEISINAGMDMVMLTTKYPQLYQVLHELVNEKKISLERIDDAVTRILRVKFAAGLFAKDYSPTIAGTEAQKNFGSPAHRAVARQAVQESLVLLKNDKKILPLSKSAKRIAVAGRAADSTGIQCGGWTLSWQGAANQTVPGATSILAAIKATAGKDTQITFAADGTGAQGADVALAIIGENPYAEGQGDNTTLALNPQDLATLANLKAANVPTVVILLSGRPLILGDALTDSTAFIAAWLPGSEGQGVADILFADAKPTGKLSFPWPKSLDQLPTAKGSPDFQFQIGYGLGY